MVFFKDVFRYIVIILLYSFTFKNCSNVFKLNHILEWVKQKRDKKNLK